MAGARVTYGEAVKWHRNLVGKPKGKRQLGILQCRWEVSIKVNPANIRSEGVDWIYLAYKRDKWQASCIHGNEIASSKMRGIWLAEVLKENSAPWSWSNSNLVAVITFLLRSLNKGLPVDMAPWRWRHAKQNEYDNLGARPLAKWTKDFKIPRKRMNWFDS